jgi:hypothetical protein
MRRSIQMTAAIAGLVLAMGTSQAGAQAALPDISHATAHPPVRLRCDGDPPLAFTIIYYDTNPATLVADRHGHKIEMIQQPMASGIRYTAAGASYSEHQGVSWIIWPGHAKALRCVR